MTILPAWECEVKMNLEQYGVFKISLNEKNKRTRLYEEAVANMMSDDKGDLPPAVKRVYAEYINGNIKNMSALVEEVKKASLKDSLTVLSNSIHHA